MDANEIEELLQEYNLTETELIFKNNIKRLRANYPGAPTMVEVAKNIGINYGKYRLMESMTPLNVSFKTMEQIAKYYGVTVESLFHISS